MPKQSNSEIRLKCASCKDFTQTISPIIISKLTENRYHIKAVCSICNKFKSKFLNQEQIRLLPVEVQQAAVNTAFNDTIELNGGIIPLIPLIGAIAAGISALASAGGATASAIMNAKNSDEDEKHHRELESIARGNSISNNIIKDDNDVKPSRKLLDNSLPNVNGNGITIDPKLAAAIISLVPAAIEVIPSAVKTIKNLINNEGNKVGEVIKIVKPKQDPVLSDDELDSRAITRMIGRGFNITI